MPASPWRSHRFPGRATKRRRPPSHLAQTECPVKRCNETVEREGVVRDVRDLDGQGETPSETDAAFERGPEDFSIYEPNCLLRKALMDPVGLVGPEGSPGRSHVLVNLGSVPAVRKRIRVGRRECPFRFPAFHRASVGGPEEKKGDVQDVETSLAESGTPSGLLSGLSRQWTRSADQTKGHQDREKNGVVFQMS